MRTNSLGISSRESSTRPPSTTEEGKGRKTYLERTLYSIGSIAGFVSIGSSFFAIAEDPSFNMAQTLTSLFLSISYFLKLPYYREKRLAFFINSLFGVGWGSAFVFSLF